MATYSTCAFSGKVVGGIGRSGISKRKPGVSFSNKSTAWKTQRIKTKGQHIDKSKKPRWVVVRIGLVVTLGLAYWLVRKRLFA